MAVHSFIVTTFYNSINRIYRAYTPKIRVPIKCMSSMLKRKRALKTISTIVNGLFRSLFASHAKINPGIANNVGTNRRSPVKSVIVEISDVRIKYIAKTKIDIKTHKADMNFFILIFTPNSILSL